ncbi:MAG: ATP synthase F1 subunit delta [Nitrospinae bacterium]|nr:ATP synthase F1 subunit delta [Nitrospinota bacterium]
MRDKRVAVRYADAALAAAKGTPEMEKTGQDLSAFAQAYAASADLRKILAHPGVSAEKKKGIVQKTAAKLGIAPKAVSVLETVLKRGRMDVVTDIAESYGVKMDELLGRQKVSVTSAFPLSPSDMEGLEKVFAKITGKKPHLELNVDRSLIGGIVASVGSKVYDGSVSNQLKRMKIKLEQEA